MTFFALSINKIERIQMFSAFFFDQDGILYNSMPKHARAWAEVMQRHGFNFTEEDCFMNEGRTGQDVIREAIWELEHRVPTEDEIWEIYEEKGEFFLAQGEVEPIAGVVEVLRYLKKIKKDIWVVTGSAQASLLDNLNTRIGPFFDRSRMITAFDVTHGKPDPEPYLMAWDRCKKPKKDCCVIENAPLGVRAGKAAGLYTVAVNTGPLADAALWNEGADKVFPSMKELLDWLKEQNKV